MKNTQTYQHLANRTHFLASSHPIRSLMAALLGALIIGLIGACTWTLPPPPALPQPTLAPSPPVAEEAGRPPDSVRLDWVAPLGAAINWAPQLVVDAQGMAQAVVVAPTGSDLVALQPEDGTTRWRFSPPTRLWSDSVVQVAQDVFAASRGGHFLLLNGLTGRIRWQNNLSAFVGPHAGLEVRSQSGYADGILYVPTAGVGSYQESFPDAQAVLLALERLEGREQWHFTSDNYILRYPFVHPPSETLYVGGNYRTEREIEEGGANRIYALNRQNGAVRWTYESDDGLVKSLWANENVVVFVGYRDYLVGLDAATGREIWRLHTGNWVQSFTAIPLPNGETAIAFGSANGFLNVVDPHTGHFIWRYNLEGTFNYPVGKPVLHRGILYFITQHGEIHALNASDGSLLWAVDTGLEVRDGVAVSDTHIFVGSVNGMLYAFRFVFGEE